MPTPGIVTNIPRHLPNLRPTNLHIASEDLLLHHTMKVTWLQALVDDIIPFSKP